MLSENIKNLRKAKGYSQEVLAERLNVVRQTVSKWENGLSVPDAKMLNRLAELFEVPLDTLVNGTVEEPEEKEDEVFDESKAFNQDMAQPQYAVSSIIGNEKDAVLTQRIEEINQRLMDCPTERGLRNPMQLASEIRENREHSTIDLKDEYTQC